MELSHGVSPKCRTLMPCNSPAAQCRIWFCACTGFPSCIDGCAYLVAALQECHRLAGVFAAYPATFMPPDPRRDPGPGRVDHLHHHAPVALCDHPTTRAASAAITGLYVEHQTVLTPSGSNQMEALQTDEQITPITTIKRHGAAAGRVRHCRGPLKIAGVEVRSSSRTSTSTRNPRSTPGHPHSTRKSRKISFRYLLS